MKKYPGEEKTNLRLRPELPADRYAVESLTREAFWDTFWEPGQQICDEHLLVHRLRKSPNYVPELNYVAEQNGKLVGHIIYSKSKIIDPAGNPHETLTFGPLSVLPEYQGQGIGKALMLHTFGVATRLGFRAVLIFGHPDYYPRVGFRRAAEFGITFKDVLPFDAFMAYPLYPGALEVISGSYHLDPVYESLTQEAALEFDKLFPPRERHTPAPVSILLNRLSPPARKAVEALNFKTLAQMKTKSLRELSALDGIDAEAIETILGLI
ncbi:MAG: N-acetyltransferase [Defluviitaleaceae bacterium]|nr:N-acetyltransferase [Defluviitaleaceae bacterium]